MRAMSMTTLSVLTAIRDGVEYGFDILDTTGLESGTVYPILSRLENEGLVRSSWEDAAAAHASGRPARRYYTITPAGKTALERAMKHYVSLIPSLGKARKAR
jgi:DNA-binding PadR family transcriptional regulator